jgi:hypothetical protein
VPGDYPFYFDEIQSTTELLPGRFSTDVYEKNIEEENIIVTSTLNKISWWNTVGWWLLRPPPPLSTAVAEFIDP